MTKKFLIVTVKPKPFVLTEMCSDCTYLINIKRALLLELA